MLGLPYSMSMGQQGTCIREELVNQETPVNMRSNAQMKSPRAMHLGIGVRLAVVEATAVSKVEDRRSLLLISATILLPAFFFLP